MLSGPQIIFFALESNRHPTGTVPTLAASQCRLRPSTASGGHVDPERTEETIHPLQKPQELRRCDSRNRGLRNQNARLDRREVVGLASCGRHCTASCISLWKQYLCTSYQAETSS